MQNMIAQRTYSRIQKTHDKKKLNFCYNNKKQFQSITPETVQHHELSTEPINPLTLWSPIHLMLQFF